MAFSRRYSYVSNAFSDSRHLRHSPHSLFAAISDRWLLAYQAPPFSLSLAPYWLLSSSFHFRNVSLSLMLLLDLCLFNLDSIKIVVSCLLS